MLKTYFFVESTIWIRFTSPFFGTNWPVNRRITVKKIAMKIQSFRITTLNCGYHYTCPKLIHTSIYVINHYNLSVSIIDLVSHTTYVVCVNFVHRWRELQFKVGSEPQIFWESFNCNFIYSQRFCQKSDDRKSPKKYFLYFDVWPGKERDHDTTQKREPLQHWWPSSTQPAQSIYESKESPNIASRQSI